MKKEVCDKSMSFAECELAILRTSVDKAEENTGRASVNSEDVKKMISIVEGFLRKKQLIAYGGTAINSILPKQDQFYNKDIELPDYDFFTPNALEDTKELCDLYAKAGFIEVEGKPGVHHGTFKVFVNFTPVADITYIHKDIFKEIKKESIRIGGILYSPPNYLRMAMFLELSRPAGDVSRWEKVMKRLTLLNKNFPLTAKNCNKVNFQRNMAKGKKEDKIFETIKSTFIDQDVVFFGGYAMALYSNYMPKKQKRRFQKSPDFDVLAEDPEKVADIIKERLHDIGVKDVRIVKRDAIGEIVAQHCEIIIGKDTVAFVYEPLACHSYNVIDENGEKIKIATIDTMLSFYLAFLYASRDYYDKDRILCMSQYLFKVQQKNRLKQKGLLRRFSIKCYGKQLTLEDMRAEKAKKYEELKGMRGTREYEEYFLRYRPGEKAKGKQSQENNTKTTKNTNTRKKRNSSKKTNKNWYTNRRRGKSTRGKSTRKRGRGGLWL